MTRPALVLLHGYPFDHTLWDGVRARLGKIPHLLVPDLRGFGGPPLGGEPPALETMAADIGGLIAKEKFDRVILAGFSMGGYVALAFAERFPEQLAGLALISSQATADTDLARNNRRGMIERLHKEPAEAAAEAALPKLFGVSRPPQEDWMDYPRRAAARAGGEGLIWALEAMAARPDRTAVLRNLHTPCLIVHSEEDQFVPVERARELTEGIPGAIYCELPGVGHCSPLEEPEGVAQALRAFVERIE